MKHIMTSLVIAVSALSGIASATNIAPIGAEGSGEARCERGGVWRQLGLSAEQTQKIQEIKKANDAPLKEKFEARRAARQEMFQLLISVGSDEALTAKSAQISEISASIHQIRLSSFLQIRGVLTAEQNQKLGALLKERMGCRRGNRDHDHGNRDQDNRDQDNRDQDNREQDQQDQQGQDQQGQDQAESILSEMME